MILNQGLHTTRADKNSVAHRLYPVPKPRFVMKTHARSGTGNDAKQRAKQEMKMDVGKNLVLKTVCAMIFSEKKPKKEKAKKMGERVDQYMWAAAIICATERVGGE